ncbi:MAG: hypothetical protein OQK75_09400 [Gammaproteobacteria bacterium]|nr:hypothetical protein [Gammaproteobacteria bacterium]MCW8987868.1 hypothetical protein [Gammaproteobacteria bacterium]MCW9031134.1 hypothetical protein [Gammaproteobacteria bacterium]
MKILSYSLIFSLVLITGCQTNPASSSARECQRLLKLANQELDFAKAKGFSGTVEFTKATTLITGASIQYEFGKYPNCIDKAKRARVFIKNSQIKK